MNTNTNTAGIIVKGLLAAAASVFILAALLFIPAGRLDWGMAWVFIGAYAAGIFFVMLYWELRNPDLLKERADIKPRPGVKNWDAILANVIGYMFLAVLPLCGLDKRFGWTEPLPLAVQALALVIGLLGGILVFGSMVSNRFFTGYTRIQTERGHTAVTMGPYRFVRHPGYAGMITLALAIPLALGSLWALVLGGLIALLLVVRTALEDKTLQKELDGYKDYAARVRYRLLPGVW